MNALVPLTPPSSPALPVLVAATGDRAGMRFLEFLPTWTFEKMRPQPV